MTREITNKKSGHSQLVNDDEWQAIVAAKLDKRYTVKNLDQSPKRERFIPQEIRSREANIANTTTSESKSSNPQRIRKPRKPKNESEI